MPVNIPDPLNSFSLPDAPNQLDIAQTVSAALPRPNLRVTQQAEAIIASPSNLFLALRQLGLEKLTIYRLEKGQPLPGAQVPDISFTGTVYPKRILEPTESGRLQGQLGDLGNIVECDLVLKGGSYLVPGTTDKITFRGLMMDTALVSVEHENRLVETELEDAEDDLIQRTGSRKSVVIRGIAVGLGNEYPKEEMIVLRKMAEAKCSIEVVSDYLNDIWGINRIALRRLSMQQEDGQGNSQTFEIEARKDVNTVTGGALSEV